MKTFLTPVIFSFLILLASQTQAQNLIAVQNGGTPTFFAKLDDAIANSVDGDTIYMPGGNFALSTNISKRLHIIGVGYHPDSTRVTNPTNIVLEGQNLNLLTGASGGSLIGVRLLGGWGVQFGTSSSNSLVTNYTIGFCFLDNITSSYDGSSNNLFYRNILGSINFSNILSENFYNNIITGGIYAGTGAIFKNNIIINGYWYQIVNTSYSTFENNIFENQSLLYSSDYNIFNNNLFQYEVTFPYGTNTGSNNIISQSASTIFVNQTGSSYNYAHDYHLQPSCPGKNAGRDGTDVGIYGGVYPWKEGAIPTNPHFQSVKIAGQTDGTGNLNVKIKVAAQDH